MKKVKFCFLLASLLCAFIGKAQLSGTKNIPGDYATLDAAIIDLNTQGVGAGGVTLNLLASNPQTTPLGGYSITATGTAVNTITITGNNNTVTAPNPQTGGNLNDAIFKIIGGDYITIQGFVMQENTLNTSTTAASNNMTEWGVAVLYASGTDGAKNITVQNNTISLNRTYQNTFGIYSSNLHTATNVTTLADITAASGANDNLHIYNNSISDVNQGICVVGSASGAFMSTGLDIGGTSVSTANTLTNYGSTGTFSAYPGVATSSVCGVYSNNNLNFNVSYNSITSSNGGTTAGTLNGIKLDVTGTLPTTGSYTKTIDHNSISVKSAVASGQINGIANGADNATISYTINSNDFNNSGHTVSGSGAINFISCNVASAAKNADISNNTFTNLSVNTTSSVNLISKTTGHPANAVITVNNNSIVGTFTKTGAGNTVFGYNSNQNSASGVSETVSNNNFSNIIVTGATTVTVMICTDGGSNATGSTKTITNNTFTNVTNSTAGAGPITILTVHGSTAASISGNTVNNITSTGNITAVASNLGGNQDFFNNTIHTLVSSGASAVVSGMVIAGGIAQNVYKNKVYNLQSNNSTVAGAVNGISVTGGLNVTIHNNLIGDLTSSAGSNADLIRGISVNSTIAFSSVNVYYNTVYLNATSSGGTFGSSGIFHTVNGVTSTAALNLNDNIVVNTSSISGAGLAVAYRRSGVSLNNYSNSSNNNLFFAGTPSAGHLIFYDGTNADQTLAAYQVRVSPRDLNSITESPTFLSTSGASANFLHVDASVATQIESGAIPIGSINSDYDGDARNSSTPDIGADEFNGLTNDLTGPSIVYTPLGNTTSTANRTIVATITDPSGVASGGSAPRIYYRKGTTDPYVSATATSVNGNDFTFTIDYASVSGGSVVAGDIIQYYIAAQDVLGNVSTVPSGGAGSTPPGSAAPAAPNRYGISLTYTWQGTTNDFQTATNWSPVRTTPDISDILIFDGSVTASTSVDNIPSQTVSRLLFQNNITVTLNAAVLNNTLTFDYAAGQVAFDVHAGSTVNVGTTTALNLSFGLAEGQVGTIAGTLNLNGSTFTVSNGSATNATTTVSGTVAINGSSLLNGGSLTTLIFNTGSVLNFTKLSGIIPTATYNFNSLINVTGITTTTSLTWPETIGGLTWNCPGQTAANNFSMNNTVTTINGSLTIQNTGAGTFNTGTNTTFTISIAGDLNISGGTMRFSGNITNISGTLQQTGGTLIKTTTGGAGLDWTFAALNQSGGLLTTNNVNGTLRLTALTGNVNVAATVDGGTGGGLIIIFAGSGNQTFNTAVATVSNKVGLTVNKSSGNCTILNDFTVNSGAAVALSNGKLTISAGKTLTIAPGASVTGANSSNYIVTEASGANVGKLSYSGLGTSPQNFPIGTVNNYMPALITPSVGGSTFTAGVFEGATEDGTPNGSPFSAATLSDLVNGVWLIDRTVVATPATITLGWNASQEGAGFSTLTNPEIGIHRYNGSSWDLAIGSGDNVANIATATFSNFSPFIVGKIQLFPLPLNLLSFSGEKQGAVNKLYWKTSGETNCRGFEIQRSSDGLNYFAIGYVYSQATGGTNSGELSYDFTDHNPAGIKQYYRLRIEDNDGRSKTSHIVLIKGDQLLALSIAGVFPNPAHAIINVIIYSPKRDDLTMVIVDAGGRIVRQEQARVDIGSNTVAVDVSKLSSGSYIIKLTCRSLDCEMEVGKFNKQ